MYMANAIFEYTVFPRNLAAARFNFKSLHPAARFQGRRDFEGGDYSPLTHFTLAFDSANRARVRLHYAYFESDDPFPCGEISRAAFIGNNLLRGAARFRGRRNFEVRRDFEEIRYTCTCTYS